MPGSSEQCGTVISIAAPVVFSPLIDPSFWIRILGRVGLLAPTRREN